MTPETIREKLNETIYGQDEAKKVLAEAAHTYLLQYYSKNGFTIATNVLFTGPSGCGKTYLTKTLATILGIPCYELDASMLTPEGYVGLSVSDATNDIIKYFKVKKLSKAKGIVFLDEIDKLTSAKDGQVREFKGNVQGELLKLIEEHPNIMWIFSGNYTELRLTRKTIGINKPLVEDVHDTSDIPEALEKIGVSSQLLGRIRYFAKLNKFTKQDFKNMLTDKKYFINKYKKDCKELGGSFKLTKKDIKHIVDTCSKGDTGARKLLQQLNLIVTDSLSKVVLNTPKKQKGEVKGNIVGYDFDGIWEQFNKVFKDNLKDDVKVAKGVAKYYKDKCDYLIIYNEKRKVQMDKLLKEKTKKLDAKIKKVDNVFDSGLINLLKYYWTRV